MAGKGKSAAVTHLKKTMGTSFSETIRLGSVLRDRGAERVWYDTGSLTLNKSINRRGRGIPGGAFTVLAGHSQAGKSLLGVLTLIDCQRQGGLAVIIDVEGSFDFEFAQKLGMDLEDLVYVSPVRTRVITKKDGKVIDNSSPLTVSDVCTLVEELLQFVENNYPKGHPCVILWDSISATNTLRSLGLEKTGVDTYKVLDGGDPKREQGGPAGWLKKWLGRLDARLAVGNTALLGVGHVYANVNSAYNVEIVSGGSGVAYYASIRLLFRKKKGKKWQIFKDDDEKSGIVIGECLEVYVDKNTVGPPYTTVQMDFFFDDDGRVHLDKLGGLLDFFVGRGVIGHKSGSTWYSYGDENFHRKDFPAFMEKHPELKEM